MCKHVRFFNTTIVLFILALLKMNNATLADGKIKGEIAVPDSNQVQIISLKDGSVLNGRIVSFTDTEITFAGSLGELVIPLSSIEEIKLISMTQIVKGKYYFPNPNKTRLFFAPTGRMLDKGEGYFSDYYLFFPGFVYGISGWFNFGGGMSIIPGVNLGNQIFFFTPKIGLKASEDLNIAAGALVIKIPTFDDTDGDDSDISSLGILYGVGTLGSPDASVTVGMGYGYAGDQLADNPIFMIGGEARLSRRTALVTENWIIPGAGNPLISYGLRFFGEKLSIDFAFITFLGEGSFFPGIPYIDFVVNF